MQILEDFSLCPEYVGFVCRTECNGTAAMSGAPGAILLLGAFICPA